MPGPLGIRDDVDLSDEQRCTLQFIEDYDLGRAVDAAIETGAIEKEERHTAEVEAKRFLGLAYLHDAEAERLAPSPKVDAVWHQFILVSTREYERFSYRVFGRFFHHEAVGDEEEGVVEIAGAGPRVQDYFEDVDEDFWADHAAICWPPIHHRD